MPNEIQPTRQAGPDYSRLLVSLTEVEDAEASRFNRPTASLLWEPGRISVELDPGMPMGLLLALSDLLSQVIPIRTLIRILSRISPPLGELLQQYDLQHIERTFRIFLQPERIAYNRPQFLTLQFPTTVDIARVSREMARH